MSHFTVLVMGKDVTDEDALEKLMLPYHEFECTGINEYIQDVDQTEEARASYEKAAKSYIFLADATMLDTYNEEHMSRVYRAATAEEVALIEEKGTNSDIIFRRTYDKGGEIYTIRDLPEGAVEREVPVKDFQSFEEYCSDYYGYEVVAGEDNVDTDGDHKHGYILKTYGGLGGEDTIKVINRTNPNAEWDWYVIGGRWSGEFLLKEGATSGVRGRPGTMMEPAGKGRYDGAKKSDIDWEAMRLEAVEARRNSWDKMVAKMTETANMHGFVTEFEAMTPDQHRTRLGKLKTDLTAQWEVEKNGRLWDYIQHNVTPGDYELMGLLFGYWDGLGESHMAFDNIEDWIQAAPGLSSYAMMIDGKWIAKGDMGWFGMSSDNMTAAEWRDVIAKAIDELPDDHELVLVDCHI